MQTISPDSLFDVSLPSELRPSQRLAPSLLEDLSARVSLDSPAVVLAGHYCLAEHMAELSAEGEAERASLEFGARLVAQANEKSGDAHLVVWVNDIAIPSDQRKAIKANYALPDGYRSILRRIDFPEERVEVRFESTMRNKASGLLRKLFKRTPELFERVDSNAAGLTRCVVDSACDVTTAIERKIAYVVPGPDGEQLVVKDGSNPKCNLILATFFEDLRKQFDSRLQVNVFNDLYSYRIALGIHVFRTVLGGETPMINVFTDGDDLAVGVASAARTG